MKIKVTYFIAGKVIEENVYAVDNEEARKVLLSRQPNANIISVTATFL